MVYTSEWGEKERVREKVRVRGEMRSEAEKLMDFVKEKWNELVMLLMNFFGYFKVEVDKLLPPESRASTLSHWIHVAAPFFLAAAVALALCCICCSRRCRRLLCCGCCCGNNIRSVKMMKAPGRDLLMPRHIFEGNPRSYFQNLRAGTDFDHLV